MGTSALRLASALRPAALRQGGAGAPQISRVLGVLYLSGSILVFLSLMLPHPAGAVREGLMAIVAAGVVGGTGSLIWAERARMWTVHSVLALGTGLICLCVYFSGVAAGVYSAMFFWAMLVAAIFLPGRQVVAHVGWIVVGWAAALNLVQDSSGFALITRWALGSFVLVVAATVIAQVVAGRRDTEAMLRSENSERQRLQLELEHLAFHDPLTGLPNRRRLNLELSREMARALRQRIPLCVVALDLDGFKSYNDTFGHLEGDRLLQSASTAWSRALRTEDLLTRIGGDEFLALLPNCSKEAAEVVCRRLHECLPAGVDASAGIVQWDTRESAEQLLHRADRAMYQQKGPPRALAGNPA